MPSHSSRSPARNSSILDLDGPCNSYSLQTVEELLAIDGLVTIGIGWAIKAILLLLVMNWRTSA